MAKNTLPLVYVCSPYSGDIKNNVEKTRMFSAHSSLFQYPAK